MENNELAHHGIKDMKWYRRRFQNYDGSLTPAGKKRYLKGSSKSSKDVSETDKTAKTDKAATKKSTASEPKQKVPDKVAKEIEKKSADKAVDKATKAIEKKGDAAVKKLEERAKNFEKKAGETADKINKVSTKKTVKDMSDDDVKDEVKKATSELTGKKSVKDMSDAELKAAISRLQLEQQYKQLNPTKVSTGRKYAMKFLDEAVVPAATQASRQVMQDFLITKGKEAAGLNQKPKVDKLAKAKRDYEMLDYENKLLKARQENERLKKKKEDKK